MVKNKHLPFRIEEEWLRALSGLAGTFGASAEEVVRQSLPEEAVIRLFFQCKDYIPDLRWDEISNIGREAIRQHLRAKYMEGLQQHMARLGLSMQTASADDIETAKSQAIEEMRADATRPLDWQIEKAEHDSVYLGYLYDAWKRAMANEPGYAIAQVDIDWAAVGGKDAVREPVKAWAVLKDNAIV